MNSKQKLVYWIKSKTQKNDGSGTVCPGHDVKRYPSGVPLDNQKVFSCT